MFDENLIKNMQISADFFAFPLDGGGESRYNGNINRFNALKRTALGAANILEVCYEQSL